MTGPAPLQVTELRAKNKEQQSEIAALRRGAAAATAAASPSAAQASLPAVSAAPVRRLKAQHVASKHAGEEAATERAALGSPIEVRWGSSFWGSRHCRRLAACVALGVANVQPC